MTGSKISQDALARVESCLKREVPTVASDSTVRSAAEVLASSGHELVPVIGPKGRVLGVFTEVDVVESLFPPYLNELRNTAFLRGSHLIGSARNVMDDPLSKHMTEDFHVVRYPPSEFQLAEHFLHQAGSIIVVDDDNHLVGIIGRAQFCRVVFESAADPEQEAVEGVPSDDEQTDASLGAPVEERSADANGD